VSTWLVALIWLRLNQHSDEYRLSWTRTRTRGLLRLISTSTCYNRRRDPHPGVIRPPTTTPRRQTGTDGALNVTHLRVMVNVVPCHDDWYTGQSSVGTGPPNPVWCSPPTKGHCTYRHSGQLSCMVTWVHFLLSRCSVHITLYCVDPGVSKNIGPRFCF